MSVVRRGVRCPGGGRGDLNSPIAALSGISSPTSSARAAGGSTRLLYERRSLGGGVLLRFEEDGMLGVVCAGHGAVRARDGVGMWWTATVRFLVVLVRY